MSWLTPNNIPSREKFFADFPWIIDLPEHPRCKECFFQQGPYEVNSEGRMTFKECHNKSCSRSKAGHYVAGVDFANLVSLSHLRKTADGKVHVL